jgi:hypothetical protein
MMEEAKENRVMIAASVQALKGRRVFTGTPNAKLIMAISLSCALIEQQGLKGVVPEASIKYSRTFSRFVRNCSPHGSGNHARTFGLIFCFDPQAN